jgi:hypothetical protein
VSYGTHTYGVTGVDPTGNVGPTTSVTAAIAAPAPPLINPVTPSTPTTTPTITPNVEEPAAKVKRPAPKVRTNAPKVKTKIVAHAGDGRRVLVSWSKVAGARRYVVFRNGHKLTVTRKHALVDKAPAHGKLRYAVHPTG